MLFASFVLHRLRLLPLPNHADFLPDPNIYPSTPRLTYPFPDYPPVARLPWSLAAAS